MAFRPSQSQNITTHGARLEKLEDLDSMRKYAAKHAESWYRYVNESRGRELVNGSLCLITGCEKSLSWGMATFQDIPLQKEFPLSFTPTAGEDDGYRYRWQGRCGRHKQADAPLVDGTPLNQTTFIHAFTISLGEGLWGKLFGKVEVSQLADSSSDKVGRGFVPFGSQASRFSWISSFGSGTSAGGNQCSAVPTQGFAIVSDTSPIPRIFHPSQIIHKLILREVPDASVVITHDDEWRDVLEDVEDSDLEKTISQYHFNIMEEDGVVFLRNKPEKKTVVQLLIEYGAALHEDYGTALAAAVMGHKKLVQLLIGQPHDHDSCDEPRYDFPSFSDPGNTVPVLGKCSVAFHADHVDGLDEVLQYLTALMETNPTRRSPDHGAQRRRVLTANLLPRLIMYGVLLDVLILDLFIQKPIQKATDNLLSAVVQDRGFSFERGSRSKVLFCYDPHTPTTPCPPAPAIHSPDVVAPFDTRGLRNRRRQVRLVISPLPADPLHDPPTPETPRPYVLATPNPWVSRTTFSDMIARRFTRIFPRGSPTRQVRLTLFELPTDPLHGPHTALLPCHGLHTHTPPLHDPHTLVAPPRHDPHTAVPPRHGPQTALAPLPLHDHQWWRTHTLVALPRHDPHTAVPPRHGPQTALSPLPLHDHQWWQRLHYMIVISSDPDMPTHETPTRAVGGGPHMLVISLDPDTPTHDGGGPRSDGEDGDLES
ncbi:hypothetical protein C8R46DRAFT_1345088 [Mycena filopes]|nr:hypothetical protein C8R46DRAFT_1345088 [Mycena filopes]